MKNLLFAHANSHNLSSGHAQEVETEVNAAYFVTFIADKLLASGVISAATWLRYLNSTLSFSDISIRIFSWLLNEAAS